VCVRELRQINNEDCLIAKLFDAVHRGRDIPPEYNDLHRLRDHAQATETVSRPRNIDNDPLLMTSS